MCLGMKISCSFITSMIGLPTNQKSSRIDLKCRVINYNNLFRIILSFHFIRVCMFMWVFVNLLSNHHRYQAVYVRSPLKNTLFH